MHRIVWRPVSDAPRFRTWQVMEIVDGVVSCVVCRRFLSQEDTLYVRRRDSAVFCSARCIAKCDTIA